MDKERNLNIESSSRIKLERDSYSNNSSGTLITCGGITEKTQDYSLGF